MLKNTALFFDKKAVLYIVDIVALLCYNDIVKKGGKQMDEKLSEIIKDLSEAFLAITSAICLIITTCKKTKSSKKSRKGKR